MWQPMVVRSPVTLCASESRAARRFSERGPINLLGGFLTDVPAKLPGTARFAHLGSSAPAKSRFSVRFDQTELGVSQIHLAADLLGRLPAE